MAKEQYGISLNGTPLTYTLTRSARARRLRISISENGINVVIPAGISFAQGEAFLRQNAAWVLEQLERRQKALAKNKRPSLPEDVVLLRGKPARVQLIEERTRVSRARVEEGSGRILVYLPQGKAQAAPGVVSHWLRELARAEIETVVCKQAKRMRVTPKTITIRDQRTRWGSCSSRGTLSFNWRLIMVPADVMEYVVIHELAHLNVPNHSPQFWSLVGQYFPEYKTARGWLKKNASLLHPRILQQN